MTVLLSILALIAAIGCGLSLYNSKVLSPAFEAERKKVMQLVRDVLPGVRIHALILRLHTHLTYREIEYFISVPNYKSDEDGGPGTSVFRYDSDRRVTPLWQRFHADSKELNARYYREALEFIKTEAPNQMSEPTSGLTPGRGSS